VASLIAGLGIGGLALALAAQKTVENLFGAFSIGVDQPFTVGDTVKVEDFLATVERIGLRSTRFRTMDRTIVTIPNGKLADSRVESYSARDRMRLATTIGVVYGTSEAQLREVLDGFARVLREQPKLWPEGVTVLLRGLGASVARIEVAAWFQTGTSPSSERSVRRSCCNSFASWSGPGRRSRIHANGTRSHFGDDSRSLGPGRRMTARCRLRFDWCDRDHVFVRGRHVLPFPSLPASLQ
jgi:MscS family membrane protein